MKKNLWTLAGGIGLGAALMYLLDSENGRRRRAVARDKTLSAVRRGGRALRSTSRDLSNRSRGLAAGLRSRFERRELDDELLRERVRALLGHLVSDPGGVEVSASEGRIVLGGHVQAREAGPVLAKIAKLRGVQSVESRLDLRDEPPAAPHLAPTPARA